MGFRVKIREGVGSVPSCRAEPFSAFHGTESVTEGAVRKGTRHVLGIKSAPFSDPMFGLFLIKIQAILALLGYFAISFMFLAFFTCLIG